MRKQILSAVLLACSAVLAGCDNHAPAENPTPSATSRINTENALLATTRLGKPVELDGCMVQAYEIDVAYPGLRGNRMFTVATANCSTANVTATNETCGKNCKHDTLRVDRKKVSDVDEAQVDVKAQAEAAAKKAAMLNKRDQLVKELEQLNAELEPAK